MKSCETGNNLEKRGRRTCSAAFPTVLGSLKKARASRTYDGVGASAGHPWFIGITLLALVVLTGCGTRAGDPRQARGYFGPTDDIYTVIERINANNEPISTLNARGEFEATLVDQGTGRFVNGQVVLLYRRPDQMLLVGRKDLAGRIFELGTNAQEYWMLQLIDPRAMWWGTYADLDHAMAGRMPLEPYLILEVLGIGTIPTNLLAEPMPVMRFNNDADAYMFVWHVVRPDRLVAQKEIWYDRSTLLPMLVLLFDSDGRIVLRAYLGNHREVPDAFRADGQPARMATTYRLFFPDSGSRMTIQLDDLRLMRGDVPSDRHFIRPDPDRFDGAVVQIR